MRIVGIRLKKVGAEKFKEAEGQIDLNTDFNLGKVKKEENAPEGAKESLFVAEFEYIVLYKDIAKIEFNGDILMTSSEDLSEKKDPLTGEEKKRLLDFVFARTHVQSLSFEEKLNLPFHISPPRTTIEESPKEQNTANSKIK
jgi:hypothetical protein